MLAARLFTAFVLLALVLAPAAPAGVVTQPGPVEVAGAPASDDGPGDGHNWQGDPDGDDPGDGHNWQGEVADARQSSLGHNWQRGDVGGA